MNYLGYSTDNTHIGKTFILNPDGDLTVEGAFNVNDINVNSLTIGDPEYTLPTSAGTDGQVIVMNPDNTTSDWQDLSAGTARVVVNKYTGTTSRIRNQTENGQIISIEQAGFGSKTYTSDEFSEGSVIVIRAYGNWTYLRSSQAFIPEGKFWLLVGPPPNGPELLELFAPFPEKAFAGTFPSSEGSVGNWELNIQLTRINATQFRLGGTLTNSLADVQNQVEIPIIFPQKVGNNPDIFTFPSYPFDVAVKWQDNSNQGGGTAWIYPTLCGYTQDLINAGTNVVATSENLTTDHLLLSNINGGVNGDGGHINLFDKRGIKPMTGNLNMNNNTLTNLQNIDTNNLPLNILSGSSFPQLNLTGGINCNNSAFLYSCPSVYAGTSNLVLGSDVGGTEIQTGPFGSRQTEMIILPNLINVNSAITNFVGGDVYMSQNRIQDLKRVDGGGAGANFIEMVDATLLNGMRIESNVGILLQETTTSNRIGINNGGLASLVANGGTIIQNTDAGNNLTLSKQNGGKIFLQNTGTGGVVEAEAEGIDINYTTTNFKVRNGLSTSFIIDGTDTESLLNFKCPSINGITPVGGIFAGTADSLTLSGSTAEQSILPTAFVGSLTVPANGFAVGDSFHLVLAGDFSSQNGDTINIRLYGGPTSAILLADLAVPLVASSGVSFEVEVDFQIRNIGGAGVADVCSNFDFTYNGGAGGAFRGERGVFQNNTTFDTTVNNSLLVTAQFSSNNANNSIKTIVSKLSKTY